MSIIDGNNIIDIIERRRLEVQHQLDSLKTQAERNKLGQFATPTALAIDIVEYAKTLLSKFQRIRFLDPAFGTGAFYSALLRVFSPTCFHRSMFSSQFRLSDENEITNC